jgi:hypothetical protein
MSSRIESAAPDGTLHPSPPLHLLAGAHAVLFLGSLVVTAALTGGGHLPSPFAPSADSFIFFSRHPEAVRWSAFLQLGAAVPLGLFAAVVASRLTFLGIRAAGVFIALFGGLGASAALALSALAQWALSSPEVLLSPAAVRSLQLLTFSSGGPAHVMSLGLLLAGVAVTTGVTGLLPRWSMASGLALAVLAELSWLSLVIPAAAYLLPIARFPALVWLVVAGALLPTRRRGPSRVPERPELRPPLGRPVHDRP